MLKIRLSRAGAKKRPFYHIVVADVRSPRDGRYKERVGFYNPMVKEGVGERLRIDRERVSHWLANGAKPTDRVHRFFAKEGLMPERVVPNQTKKNLANAKTIELEKSRKEKLASKQAQVDEMSSSSDELVEEVSVEEEVSSDKESEGSVEESTGGSEEEAG